MDLLEKLLPVYRDLLEQLAEAGAEWVQIDEPALVTELGSDWKRAFENAYHALKSSRTKLLLATYFGTLQENLQLAVNLPVAGLHVDAVRGGRKSVRWSTGYRHIKSCPLASSMVATFG